MSQAIQIINSLIKIQEQSNLFPHEWELTFDNLNLLEVHCIDWIGTIEYANVTKIANGMKMTRGAISKISKRLVCKEFIESYQRPDNNKEIYYRLTKSGQHVYNEHQKCHSQARQEKLSLLDAYNDYEQSIILRFLNDINHLHNSMLNGEKQGQEV